MGHIRKLDPDLGKGGKLRDDLCDAPVNDKGVARSARATRRISPSSVRIHPQKG